MNTNNQKYDLIIKNANIINVETGNIIIATDIGILNDRIIKVGKSIVADDSVKTIDATGKFVIPGLWDMHVHNWKFNRYHPLYLANGVTGIRDMWGCFTYINKLREQIKSKEIIGPEIIGGSAIIDGPNPYWSRSDSVITEQEGQEIVKKHLKNGADFIKTYNKLSKEAFKGIADECSKQKIPFAGHIPWSISYIDAVNAGIKSIEHLDGVVDYCISTKLNTKDFFSNLADFDETKFSDIIQITKEKNIWHCPTLALYKHRYLDADDIFFHDKRLKYVENAVKKTWMSAISWKLKAENAERFNNIKKYCELRIKIVNLFNANGIKFIAGTDLGNAFLFAGFSLHDELSVLVDAGLSPVQSLQTATLNPAIFLDKLDDFGTVSENKVANLVILNKNPLENINNTTSIDSVIQRGESYCRAELDNLLQDVEDFAQRKPLSEILFEKIQAGKLAEVLSECQSNNIMSDRPKLEKLDTELFDLTTKLIESSNFEFAEKIAILNLNLHKDTWITYLKLAECYLKNDKFNQMDDVLIKAFEKSDKLVWALIDIIWMMLKSKNYNLVKEYAIKSLEIFPYVNNLKFLYAHSLLLTGEFEKAKEIYLTYKESLIRENDLKVIKEIGIENADLNKMIELVYAKEQG